MMPGYKNIIHCNNWRSPSAGTGLNNFSINPLNSELNPICHLLALLGGATIVVVSRLRVKTDWIGQVLKIE
jgi:hypothetical protein